ncbi:MAG: tetratricopeptide repeat protein [Capsulimonadaceae bacterium]|nr:tetratricopeptide repeat protein [Capsulimonadaceae bacterium]
MHRSNRLRSDPVTHKRAGVPWRLIGLLFTASVLIYLPCVNNGFVSYNDAVYIVNNPDINPVSPQSFVRYWTGPRIGLYQPMDCTLGAIIAMVAHMAAPASNIAALGGTLNPHVYHLVSVLVHALNALLLYFLLRRLALSEIASLSGAGLFAIHPMQVESVAWASASDRLFCIMFSIPALLLYLRAPNASETAIKTYTRYGASVVLGILAVLCKPTAIVLPLIALILDRELLRHRWRTSFARYAVWQLAVLPILFLASASVAPTDQIPPVPISSRIFIAGDSLAFSLGKFLFPVRLSLDYGRAPQFVLQHWWVFVTWVFPAAVAFALWRLTRPGSPIRTGSLVFLIGLAPTLGLISFPSQIVSTVADRYMYPALIGASIVVGAVVDRLMLRALWKPFAYAGAAFSLAVLALLTLLRIPVWSDSISLMRDTLNENPKSYNALTYLGKEYESRGQSGKALPFFLSANAIRPNYYQPHYNLATAYAVMGNFDAAIAELNVALQYAPDHTETDLMLGNCYLAKRDLAKARAAYETAIKVQPDDALAFYDLANLALLQGDYYTAERDFAMTIHFAPRDAFAHAHLAKVLMRVGDLDQAQSEAQLAQSLAAGSRDYLEIMRLLSH